MTEGLRLTTSEAHLYFAKELNAETWRLLEAPRRSAADDERMLAAAFGSYFHWLTVGAELHKQRSEYLVARVYLALGNWSEALSHAERCLELTEAFAAQMQPYDFGYAYEIYARANAACGHREIGGEYREKARQAGQKIEDDEDLRIFSADLNSGDWFDL